LTRCSLCRLTNLKLITLPISTCRVMAVYILCYNNGKKADESENAS
jgi:hypothetical protein